MSEEEKKEINIGLEQADNGILISNEKVMQRFKKWH
jgi:predicted transcriptional regulator